MEGSAGGLQAAGHEVYALTPTGLGERSHLASPAIGLDTWMQDVVNVLAYEDLRDVVLVGHSFGGMVLPAVADRAADRLARLIYLDALLPRPGECRSTCPPRRCAPRRRKRPGCTARAGASRSFPATTAARRRCPSSRASSRCASRGPGSDTVPGVYIHCTAKTGWDYFAPFADRARARGWPVYELATGHSPLRSEADRTALVDLLLTLV